MKDNNRIDDIKENVMLVLIILGIITGLYYIGGYLLKEIADVNNDTYNKIKYHHQLKSEDIKKLNNIDNVILISTCKSLTHLSKSSLEYQLNFNLNTNKEIICRLAKDKEMKND